MEILYIALDILLVLLGFTFIIAIHEAGHFVAAKRAGVECPVFSIGFPLPGFFTTKLKLPDRWRNICSFHYKGTDYKIGWIPFGGFVQMKGQDDNPTADEENTGDQDDYRNVSYGNKVLILSGGVIMNAITGIVFFILAFAVFGATFVSPVVGQVASTDYATEGGATTSAWLNNKIGVGDKIVEVEGRVPVDFEDVIYASFFSESNTVSMTFERPDGTRYTEDVEKARIRQKLDLKIAPILSDVEVVAGLEEALRSDGTFHRNDRITAIKHEGEWAKVTQYSRLAEVLSLFRAGEALSFQVENDGEVREVQYTPRAIPFINNDRTYGMAFRSHVLIKAVQKNSPASKSGMKSGDLVIGYRPAPGSEIRKIESHEQFSELIKGSKGKEITLVVRRIPHGTESSNESKNPVTPVEQDVKVSPEQGGLGALDYRIGVIFSFSPDELKKFGIEFDPLNLLVADVSAGSNADIAGIRAGDEITGVPGHVEGDDKEAIAKYLLKHKQDSLEDALEGKEIAPLKLKVKGKDGAEREVELNFPEEGQNTQPFMAVSQRQARSPAQTFSIGKSIALGFEHTERMTMYILQTLKGLFSGQVSITNLSGPVMIAKASYDISQYGFGTLLFFLGFISINLAIVNILPIPVLDGGHLLIETIQKIIRRPINEQLLYYVHIGAFLLIIGLMLFVIFNDIRNLAIIYG